MSKDPFGLLYQHEAEYLNIAGVGALERSLLVALRMRVDGRTRACHDTQPTLARWAGLSTRKVQAGMRQLEALHIIERHCKKVEDGPRGVAWSWTTIPHPYEMWSPDPLLREIAARIAYLRVFGGKSTHAVRPLTSEEHAPDAPSSGKSTHRSEEEHAQNGGRARTEQGDNPEGYPRDLSIGTSSLRSDVAAPRRGSFEERRGARRDTSPPNDLARCACRHVRAEHDARQCHGPGCSCSAFTPRLAVVA